MAFAKIFSLWDPILKDSKRFSRRYIGSLGSILVLAVVGLWVLQWVRQDQIRLAELINVSGRQRMLSQRIALLIKESAEHHDSKESLLSRRQLNESLALFKESHLVLTGSKLSSIYQEGAPTLQSLVDQFTSQVDDIILDLNADRSPSSSDLTRFYEFTKGPLLQRLDHAVSEFQFENESVDRRLLLIESFIFSLLILIFILETILVFMPIIQSLRQALRTSEQNVTKLAETQKDLRESQESFKGIFERSALGIYLATLEGRFTQVSPSFCEMLGYQPEEIVGKTFADLSHPEDRFVGYGPARDIADGNKERVTIEKRYLHKSGKPVWVIVNGSLLRDTQGKAQHLLAVVSDITQIKQAQEELRLAKETAQRAEEAAVKAARVKSEFLANMSHEIRTPLNGVIGMTDLLLETPLNEVQEKYARIISESGNGLLNIINDILDFSKIEAGKMSLEILDFSLANIIESQVELLIPRARAKNLAVTTFIDPRLHSPIKGDPGRIGQVLLNLLSNAIKFTSEGRVAVRAELKTEPTGDWIDFTVTDTGVGIPREIQLQLFRPFTQADGSTARKYGGTGLGLSISKQIVELMAGQIGVESEEGWGAKFWFRIPYVPAESRQVEVLFEPEQSALLTGRRILVAEDNVVNQLLIKALVLGFGCSVHVVANGKEVLTALKQASYDLILMDCQMPEMDGYEATRAIRDHEAKQGGHIPVVALTANALKDDVERCRASGMDEYISKPVKKEHLFAVLEGFFKASV